MKIFSRFFSSLITRVGMGVVFAAAFAAVPLAAQSSAGKAGRNSFTPFLERYVLDELKSLRTDLQARDKKLTEKLAKQELALADRAINYSYNTVTYFFYIIAAAASLLVIVGWQSLRDLKTSVKSIADKEITRLTEEYEHRLTSLEEQLREKSREIVENQEKIEETQEVQSLWIAAAQAPDPHVKIEFYDRILKIKVEDPEALVYKADAALEMGEKQWALSLVNRVLEQNPENSLALYQRACALTGLERFDEAVTDLTRAVELADVLKERALEDPDLEELRKLDGVQAVLT